MDHDREATKERRVPSGVLAGVAVVACVLAALASGGAGGGGDPALLGGSGAADVLSLVGVVAFTVLLLSGSVMFVLLLASPVRPRDGGPPARGPSRGRARAAALVLATGAAVVAALLRRDVDGEVAPAPSGLGPGALVEASDAATRSLSSTQAFASQAVGVVVAIAAVIMVGGALAIAAVKLRHRSRPAAATTTGADEPVGAAAPAPTTVEDLATAEPRRAVLLAWAAAERLLSLQGRGRRPAETAAEHVGRVAPGLPSPAGAAVTDLSGRFSEARFSTHPTSERERAAAIDDLRRLRATLADQPGPADAADSSPGSVAAADSSPGRPT